MATSTSSDEMRDREGGCGLERGWEAAGLPQRMCSAQAPQQGSHCACPGPSFLFF